MMVPAVSAVPNVVANPTNVWGFEIQPSALKVGFNQTFTVNATVTWTEGDGIAGAMMHLTFDPTLLECTNITIPATLPNPPSNSTPDRAPGMPAINNTAGWVEDGYSTPYGVTDYIFQSFVFATLTFKSKSNEGTSPLAFTTAGNNTKVMDNLGDDYLNWTRVVNGTVKVGKANLTINVGQDLVFQHTTANYSCIIPGMYANNVTEYRRATGAGTGRMDFCPWANRIALGAIPVMIQGADLAFDAYGDLTSRTIYTMAYVSGWSQASIVQTYDYGLASHGAPYSVGKNWTYNVSMYLPDMGMWSNGTYWANVTAYEMVPLNAGCGVPEALPCYKIVRTNLGTANVSEVDWFADPTYAPGLGFVKMIDYETYVAPDTSVLSGITGPAGTITIQTAPNAGTPTLPNTTKWDWNTNVTLTANALPGYTFSHWNSYVPATGLPVPGLCSQPATATLMVSDDTFVWAYFCQLPPAISVAPANFTGASKFSCRKGMENPANQTLDIWNSGGGTLNWTLVDDADWLNENMTSGSLTTGQHDFVLVSVEALSPEKAVGTYWANITISGSSAVVVPVELEVREATTITVMRDLPGTNMNPDQTYPGDTFTVFVNFTSPTDDFNAISLVDQAPAGWTVDTNTTWCTPEADEAINRSTNVVEIAWHGIYAKGTNFSAVYRVTVPNTAAPGINLFPLDNGVLAWAGYHFGAEPPMGQYSSNITGEYQMMITVPGKVWGLTRDVNAHLLDTVLVTLYEQPTEPGDEPEDTCSSAQPSAVYSNDVDDTGYYWEEAQKWCYNPVLMNAMPLTRNPAYPLLINLTTPELLAAGEEINFEGDYGLVPRACDVTYAMESVNKCNFVPKDTGGTPHPTWRLTSWKAMESVNAWTHPQSCVV